MPKSLKARIIGFKSPSIAKKALAHAQQHQPDLIILDSMIPSYNGLKVAQVLKKYP
ncbi:response regulator [Candidatus Competibacter phosphatis]|uniref:Response regulator n=1 Tax=Candidatus Competibacter phosphatis TaxID=221280 RepID=A0ABX1TLG7_9GAMM|nr:response regulator [Candidatus Competibacter phosphatis]